MEGRRISFAQLGRHQDAVILVNTHQMPIEGAVMKGTQTNPIPRISPQLDGNIPRHDVAGVQQATNIKFAKRTFENVTGKHRPSEESLNETHWTGELGFRRTKGKIWVLISVRSRQVEIVERFFAGLSDLVGCCCEFLPDLTVKGAGVGQASHISGFVRWIKTRKVAELHGYGARGSFDCFCESDDFRRLLVESAERYPAVEIKTG